MQYLPIAEAKAKFSEVIKMVEAGEDVIITRGAAKEQVAAIVPMDRYKHQKWASRMREGFGFARDWFEDPDYKLEWSQEELDEMFPEYDPYDPMNEFDPTLTPEQRMEWRHKPLPEDGIIR
ncbi:MAG: type II toxin-antitoxin system prevent-host-death family antitoxin [Propionibacteriaceae bacterium]|jgi:prevent-host-death family protein|nr:type II toxin-antitoxin system prevent-host-death family antitoxin [Propionibacteriaceae bacterium]